VKKGKNSRNLNSRGGLLDPAKLSEVQLHDVVTSLTLVTQGRSRSLVFLLREFGTVDEISTCSRSRSRLELNRGGTTRTGFYRVRKTSGRRRSISWQSK